MKTKKNKGLSNQACLVSHKEKLLKIYKAREECIAIFFNDYEHYTESIKLLLEVQQCAFTSAHFKSLNAFQQEEIQLRFPKVMALLMDLGQEKYNN